MNSIDCTKKIEKFKNEWEEKTRTANSFYQSKDFDQALDIYLELQTNSLQMLKEHLSNSSSILKLIDLYIISSENLAQIYNETKQKSEQIKNLVQISNILLQIINHTNFNFEVKEQIMHRYNRCQCEFINEIKNINPKITDKIVSDLAQNKKQS